MNERIKELAFEAINFRLDPDSNYYVAQLHPEDLEYFAELIIEECLGQLFISDPTEDFDKGVLWSVKQIKKHFGVEE